MAITTEQKLIQLENSLKELKATYSIYSGMVKTYITRGEWDMPNGASDLRIKFTPNYSTGQNTLISSAFYTVTINGREEILDAFYMWIQDGSGEVIFDLSVMLNNSKVMLQIATTVPGTFTRIS